MIVNRRKTEKYSTLSNVLIDLKLKPKKKKKLEKKEKKKRLRNGEIRFFAKKGY